MAANPEIQEKVHQELDANVHTHTLPSLHDRSKMIYIEAVVNEVFRWATILPHAVLHEVVETFTFHGHEFPAGTRLAYSLWSVHRDPNLWDEPEQFKPERFIGADGKIDKSMTDQLIQFGVGK